MAKSNAERLRNHHSIYLREGVWSGVRHHAGTRLKDDLTPIEILFRLLADSMMCLMQVVPRVSAACQFGTMAGITNVQAEARSARYISNMSRSGNHNSMPRQHRPTELPSTLMILKSARARCSVVVFYRSPRAATVEKRCW